MCGWVNEQLTLADRTFYCRVCDMVIDRDLNAAINLANLVNKAKLAGSSSESQNACGEDGAGQGHVALVKLSSLKQEPDAFDASA